MTEHLGLATAATFGNDPDLAGFSDTLGMASLAMRACGKRDVLSEASVIHYFNVSYEHPEVGAAKLEDCTARLDRLRRDPTSQALPGPWGPWE